MLTQEVRAVKRGKAFTEQEKLLLYQCMLPDLEILDNKAMDTISVARKTEAWRRVTVKFNSHPNVFQRTTEQLKKCFENAKCRKQWIVPPDSATGILEPVGQSSTPRSASTASFNRFIQNKEIGAIVIPENAVADFDRNHEDLHCNPQQRLDDIKCELVDLVDGSEDMLKDPGLESEVIETHVQSVLNDFVEETDQSEYAGQQILLENSNSEEDIDHDLEDVTGPIFLDQSIYNTAEVDRSFSLRKRIRHPVDALRNDGEAEQSQNDNMTNTSESPDMEALKQRLLQARVREAETAAEAAELHLQLSEMALQHAEAEEVRRKQLHALRVRRLSQLLTDQSGGDC